MSDNRRAALEAALAERGWARTGDWRVVHRLDRGFTLSYTLWASRAHYERKAGGRRRSITADILGAPVFWDSREDAYLSIPRFMCALELE